MMTFVGFKIWQQVSSPSSSVRGSTLAEELQADELPHAGERPISAPTQEHSLARRNPLQRLGPHFAGIEGKAFLVARQKRPWLEDSQRVRSQAQRAPRCTQGTHVERKGSRPRPA